MPNRVSKSGSQLFITDIALHETIRLMAEIDKVIDAHGGWPGAFLTDKKAK